MHLLNLEGTCENCLQTMNFEFEVSQYVVDVAALATSNLEDHDHSYDGACSGRYDTWFTEHHPLHEIQNIPVEADEPNDQSAVAVSSKSQQHLSHKHIQAKAPLWQVRPPQQSVTVNNAASSTCTGTTVGLRFNSKKSSAADRASPYYVAGSKPRKGSDPVAGTAMSTKENEPCFAAATHNDTNDISMQKSSKKRSAQSAQLTEVDVESMQMVDAQDNGGSNTQQSGNTNRAAIKAPVPTMSTQPTKRARHSQVKVHIEPTRKPVAVSKIYTGKNKADTKLTSNQPPSSSNSAIDIHEESSALKKNSNVAQDFELPMNEGVDMLLLKVPSAEIGGKQVTVKSVIIKNAKPAGVKPIYMPTTHSVKDTRRWEKKTGKRWLELSAEEREVASAEIDKLSRE